MIAISDVTTDLMIESSRIRIGRARVEKQRLNFLSRDSPVQILCCAVFKLPVRSNYVFSIPIQFHLAEKNRSRLFLFCSAHFVKIQYSLAVSFHFLLSDLRFVVSFVFILSALFLHYQTR